MAVDQNRPSTGMRHIKSFVAGNYMNYDPGSDMRPSTSFTGPSTNFSSIHHQNIQNYNQRTLRGGSSLCKIREGRLKRNSSINTK